ncbi:MAG TPA: hypothetical protein VM432_12690 [Bdellovibrionales bacterium]|jgi:hypothetical protein|nr:hypothetical protein [Bdellovibrionales bacterium]
MKSVLTISALLLCAWNLTACSGQVISEDATTPEKASTVVIEKHDQRVKRYNCDGNLISDKIEEVKPPRVMIEIHPKRSDWSYETISYSQFKNVKTGDDFATIYDGVKFVIDYNPGYYNLHVNKGLNEIKYRFDFTDGETESGSRFIDVHLQTERLDGIYEVRPSEEECKEPEA